jgi:hypothetical protein
MIVAGAASAPIACPAISGICSPFDYLARPRLFLVRTTGVAAFQQAFCSPLKERALSAFVLVGRKPTPNLEPRRFDGRRR